MRVAVYYNNRDVRLEERPKPEIGPGEILVKVLASGICGTDVMEWYRVKKAPRVLGHEIVGEIVESKSMQFKVGQRVFVSHHVPCEECKYCLAGNQTACETLHQGNYDPGGYSEFVRVPAINVERGTYVLPDSVSDEEGTMIEPLACAVRGQRVIGVREGQTVLVQGCGVSGLLNIVLAKLRGLRVIATDINESRLAIARKYGADQVINAKEKFEIKADRVIVCAGALSAAAQAFACVDRKGIILFFAIPERNIEIPTADFWRNEITVTSSYGAAPVDLAEALALIRDKKVNIAGMITHRLPLTEIQKGFLIVAKAQDCLKIVIKPWA
jgi:L-iditol 2-dehydrogenase